MDEWRSTVSLPFSEFWLLFNYETLKRILLKFKYVTRMRSVCCVLYVKHPMFAETITETSQEYINWIYFIWNSHIHPDIAPFRSEWNSRPTAVRSFERKTASGIKVAIILDRTWQYGLYPVQPCVHLNYKFVASMWRLQVRREFEFVLFL